MDYAIAKLTGKLPASEKSVHSAQIRIKLIDGRLFTYGNSFLDDCSHRFRLLHVIDGISANDQSFWAHEPRLAHGHPRVHAKGSGFITACRNHPTITCSTNEDGDAMQPAIHEPLDRHKESIEVHV